LRSSGSGPGKRGVAAEVAVSPNAQESDYVFGELVGRPAAYCAGAGGSRTSPAAPHAGPRTCRRAASFGHHSPGFTLAVYAHVLPDDLPDLGALLGVG
jgi:hypothetical protein